MRRRFVPGAILLVLLVVADLVAGQPAHGSKPRTRPQPQPRGQWRVVESKDVRLRFRLPASWQTKAATRNGRPCVEAISPKSTVYLHACSFRNGELSLDDVLDRTLDDLGVELDDDPDEEQINGLDALVAETTDTFNGRDVGMFVVVAGYGEMRYVVYLMTKANLFDANARTMNRIVDSLAPLSSLGK